MEHVVIVQGRPQQRGQTRHQVGPADHGLVVVVGAQAQGRVRRSGPRDARDDPDLLPVRVLPGELARRPRRRPGRRRRRPAGAPAARRPRRSRRPTGGQVIRPSASSRAVRAAAGPARPGVSEPSAEASSRPIAAASVGLAADQVGGRDQRVEPGRAGPSRTRRCAPRSRARPRRAPGRRRGCRTGRRARARRRSLVVTHLASSQLGSFGVVVLDPGLDRAAAPCSNVSTRDQPHVAVVGA